MQGTGTGICLPQEQPLSRAMQVQTLAGVFFHLFFVLTGMTGQLVFWGFFSSSGVFSPRWGWIEEEKVPVRCKCRITYRVETCLREE